MRAAAAREDPGERGAGLAEFVDFQVGDAVELIGELPSGIDLVLVDLWKDLYVPCLEALLPKLSPGALIVADNMILPPGDDARRYREAVRGLGRGSRPCSCPSAPAWRSAATIRAE